MCNNDDTNYQGILFLLLTDKKIHKHVSKILYGSF